MANRAQFKTPMILPALAVVVVTVLVGANVIGYADQIQDPETAAIICENEYGSGAEAVTVNVTSQTGTLFWTETETTEVWTGDCRLKNGTVVRDVPINLTS